MIICSSRQSEGISRFKPSTGVDEETYLRQGPGKIQTTRNCGICAQTGNDRLKEQSADPFADFHDDGYHPPAGSQSSGDDDEDECQADPDGEGEKTGGGAAENFRATRCPAPRKVKWNPQFLESLHKCMDAEKFLVGGETEPEVLVWARSGQDGVRGAVKEMVRAQRSSRESFLAEVFSYSVQEVLKVFELNLKTGPDSFTWRVWRSLADSTQEILTSPPSSPPCTPMRTPGAGPPARGAQCMSLCRARVTGTGCHLVHPAPGQHTLPPHLQPIHRVSPRTQDRCEDRRVPPPEHRGGHAQRGAGGRGGRRDDCLHRARPRGRLAQTQVLRADDEGGDQTDS